MIEGNSNRIPNYLSSASPNGLRRLMLMLSAKLGYEIKYFDIQFSNGKWFAWYNFEIKNDDELLKGK